MEFLGIGPGELLLILVIALIVFGPRRLPEIGRTLGKTIRDFRQASQDLTVQLRSEIDSASAELTAASEELSGHHKPMVSAPVSHSSDDQGDGLATAEVQTAQTPDGEPSPPEGQRSLDATDQELC